MENLASQPTRSQQQTPSGERKRRTRSQPVPGQATSPEPACLAADSGRSPTRVEGRESRKRPRQHYTIDIVLKDLKNQAVIIDASNVAIRASRLYVDRESFHHMKLEKWEKQVDEGGAKILIRSKIFDADRIMKVFKYFKKELGCEPIIVIPAWRKNCEYEAKKRGKPPTHDPKGYLLQLETSSHIAWSYGGDDDETIIRLAVKYEAPIVSKDKFREWISEDQNRNRVIARTIRSYTFEVGKKLRLFYTEHVCEALHIQTAPVRYGGR